MSRHDAISPRDAVFRQDAAARAAVAAREDLRDDLRATASIAGLPIHAMLVPVPIVCFVGALLTDITYWRTAEMMWSDFSAWLITVGVVIGWLAALAGIIDFASSRGLRALASGWPHVIGGVVVLVLASFNMLVHTHDAWTSVVPWGLGLSVATVIVLIFSGWMGWAMVYRHGAAVVKP